MFVRPFIGAGVTGVDLLNGLISWWSFDSVLTDSHGANNLTGSGSYDYVAGKVGNCFRSTLGGSEYALSSNPGIGGGQSWTYAGWLNLASFPTTTVFAKVGHGTNIGAANNDWMLYIDGTEKRPYLFISNGSAFQAVGATSHAMLSAAAWYYVIAEHDWPTHTIGISVNLSTKNTLGSIATPRDGGDPFYVGRYTTSIGMLANLDETAIWNRLLSDAEKTWLYNGGAGRAYADL